MAAPDDHEPSFPDAVYQKVKDWIAQQEAFEKENKAAAPLTDVQRAFLDGFRAWPPLPDIGQMNFVGLLCQYRQVNPKGKDITFAEKFHDTRNKEGNPNWVCTVELSEALDHEPAITSFPAAGFGLDASGCYLPFAKKKDAKQYAAKCAIEWLIQQSLMHPNLQDVAVPKVLSPAQALADLQRQPEKRPNEGTNGVLSPPHKRKANGTTGTGIAEVDDENLPATQRVQALCHGMKLGTPTYILILADPSVNNVFDGHPDFGDDEDSFPEDLGRVEGVTGKEKARQEVAKKVFVHLLGMFKERMAERVLHAGTTSS